jgi:hypothetical protein
MMCTVEILRPVDSVEQIIETIEISYFRTTEFEVNSIRKSAPYEEFIEIFWYTTCFYEAILGVYILESELLTLSLDEGFESRLAGEDISLSIHGRSI